VSGAGADQVAENETLTQIARRLAGAGDLPSAFDLLASGAMSLLGGEGAIVARAEGNHFRVEAAAGALIPMTGFGAPLAGSLAADALGRAHPLVLNDTAGDTRVDAHFLGAFAPRQLVVAPMIVADVPRGFVMVLNSSKGYFAPADGALLQRLADHGAIVVRYGELVTRSDAAARDARAISDIVQEINQSLELERVLSLIARHSAALLAARGTRVTLFDGGSLVTVATFGDASDRIGALVDPSTVFAGEAIRRRQAVASDDLRAYADQWARTGRGVTKGEGRANGVAAPLLVGGRVLGAITVFGLEARDPELRDANALQSIANHAAVAIENARLYRAAAHTARHASVLAATARALAISESPDAIYASISEIIHESLGAAGFTVVTGDGEARVAVVSHSEGIGRDWFQGWLWPRFWDSPAAQVLATRRARFASDVEDLTPDWAAGVATDPDGIAVLQAAGVRSIALVPLATEGIGSGVLVMRFESRHRFEEHERRLLEDFATQVGVAVRNAQLASTERSGRDRAQMLATALATMEHPVFVLDPDGHIRYANPAAAREYGHPVETLASRPIAELFDPAAGTNQVHARRDGSEFPATVTTSQFRDDRGLTAGQVVSVHNATEPQRLAEAMHQTEKLAALGELVAGVAHELNNPLTGISTFAQLLLDEQLGPEQLESVRTIKRESDRAVGVIRDLLVFARKSGPRLVPVDVANLARQTLRLRAYALQTAGIVVDTEFDPALPAIPGDDQKLQQVLLNLIVNAEYAMHRTPTRRLTVRAKHDVAGRAIVVEVTDTGVGMTADVAKHIFEPFFTTKPVGVGTGLGLSVSYGIVQAHNGTIRVDSTPGTGTSFHITLPIPAEVGAVC
jgi:signal transduction histidine kinase/GAF domain-containing protein